LHSLNFREGDAYASDIINKLKESELIVVEGTLYPLLTRQKNAGLLSYRWEESTQGPPRKYYALTDGGREFLKDLDTAWNELVDAIESIKKPNYNNINKYLTMYQLAINKNR